MKLSERIIAGPTLGTDVLRIVLCAILFTHGSYRFLHGDVTGLADLLKAEGVPLPLFTASLITLAETLGTALVLFRLMVLPTCLVLATIEFAGIMMFNRHNGFFTVGAGDGGWEYNALLITCNLVTIWENRKRPFW
jgi:putative oxidoreductase